MAKENISTPPCCHVPTLSCRFTALSPYKRAIVTYSYYALLNHCILHVSFIIHYLNCKFYLNKDLNFFPNCAPSIALFCFKPHLPKTNLFVEQTEIVYVLSSLKKFKYFFLRQANKFVTPIYSKNIFSLLIYFSWM